MSPHHPKFEFPGAPARNPQSFRGAVLSEPPCPTQEIDISHAGLFPVSEKTKKRKVGRCIRFPSRCRENVSTGFLLVCASAVVDVSPGCHPQKMIEEGNRLYPKPGKRACSANLDFLSVHVQTVRQQCVAWYLAQETAHTVNLSS